MVGKRDDRGLFIVLESIDGGGTTTQQGILAENVRRLSKYNDVLVTHEPWKSSEIKRKLAEDKQAYSDAFDLASLFVGDRIRHTNELIRPVLRTGGIVISDRYSMSTCASQGAQGIDVERLVGLHDSEGIIIPDMTIFFSIDAKTAAERIAKRGEPLEKFEKDKRFVEELITAYDGLTFAYPKILGEVSVIDAKGTVEEVAHRINKVFGKLYHEWDSKRNNS